MSNKRFAFLCQDDGSYHNIRLRYAVHQPNASKTSGFSKSEFGKTPISAERLQGGWNLWHFLCSVHSLTPVSNKNIYHIT